MKTTSSTLIAAFISVCYAGPLEHVKRLPDATTTTQAQCVAGPTTVNGRSCSVTCGLDRPGGDYGLVHTGTFDGCIQACGADAKCVTAQFHADNGFCYLKDTSNNGVSDENNYTVDCSPAASTQSQCTSGTRVFGSRSCTVSCGVDRPGGDYGNQQTWSFEQCVQICAADSKCVTVQYHEDNGFCYFKNTKNAAVSINGEDTADCDPPTLLADGAPCTYNTASSCASGVCNANSKCGKLPDGQGYCQRGSDCTSGFCNSRGVCGLVRDGGGCDYDFDCVSNLCNCGDHGPRNCGYGVCGLGRTGSACLGNYQCASGSCFDRACQ